ncbi:DUF11 domain-containing protein [Sphaerimonospora mesophila]|uniref:DUF11 domain-containing protein n=1 Tax=Sphaerimonospora mesophila TaxID=37483 RepID=UPI0006E1AD00
MHNPIGKIAKIALVAPLAGAVFLTTAPAASAAPAAPAAARAVAAKLDDPYSVFKVKVSHPKAVKVNRKITYKIRAVNTGPHHADYYWMTGILPKGVKKVWYSGPKDSACEIEGRAVVCWSPYVLEVGDYDWLNLTIQMKKGYRGKAEATLGAIVFDVPTGAENLDPRALKELGYKSWFYGKKVTTKVVK